MKKKIVKKMEKRPSEVPMARISPARLRPSGLAGGPVQSTQTTNGDFSSNVRTGPSLAVGVSVPCSFNACLSF